MKLRNIFYTLLAGAAMLTSCDNSCPTFDDKNACVGFSQLSYAIGEADGSINIPVYLASVAGISGTAKIEIDPSSTAVMGKDFTVSSLELSFSASQRTANIEVNVVNNDIFTGDKIVIFNIVSASVNLSAETSTTLKITDDEHPLKALFNTYAGTATSYFGGTYDVALTIEKDAEDNSKVWISNMDPYFASYGYVAPNYNYFYGIVNADLTEISVPAGQAIGYDTVKLEGFDGPNPDEAEQLSAGAPIIIKIINGGASLEIPNAYGACATDGWWELYFGGIKLAKK
ncbi:MAG: Calx-beta domain-containing protein [Parabacteroides sp.]|nr:Calx-beta domain-containing protein [Parabacteroides sp.]